MGSLGARRRTRPAHLPIHLDPQILLSFTTWLLTLPAHVLTYLPAHTYILLACSSYPHSPVQIHPYYLHLYFTCLLLLLGYLYPLTCTYLYPPYHSSSYSPHQPTRHSPCLPTSLPVHIYFLFTVHPTLTHISTLPICK